jgi:hypothetical protein
MGTRSYIAMKIEDGYVGVYAHWDGYIKDGVGETLQNHYRKQAKIFSLIAHGSISSVGREIGRKHDFDDRVYDPETGEAIFTTYYHRDRGEPFPNNAPMYFEDIDMLRGYAAQNTGAEYLYLYEKRRWYVADRGSQYFGLSDGSGFSKFETVKRRLNLIELAEAAKQEAEKRFCDRMARDW